MNSKKKNKIIFDIIPLAYLKRAKRLLKKNDMPSLFYAALELRCAIEARAREQLFSIKKLSKKARRLWSAEKIMSKLEKEIYGAKFGIVFNFIVHGSKRRIRPFTYKPIDKHILAEYGRLGELLHSQRQRISARFKKRIKKWLNGLYAKVEEKCSGHMLKPPIWKIKCSKCGRLFGWEDLHKGKGELAVCGCGHRTSLMGKTITMTITVIKKSSRTVELRQANLVEGKI